MHLTVLTTVLLVLTNTCLTIDPLAEKYGELVFSSVLYRHGDRAISKQSYPKDPYRNISYWPMGYGQLTNQGKERHFEFGKWIRNRYSDFLPIEYSNNDIYIRSTNVDRVIMSAMVNLAGLYPPDSIQQWNNNLGKLWQPIPIHSYPMANDKLLTFGESCPRYIKEIKSIHYLPTIQKFNVEHQELYSYLKENSGMNFTDPIYDSTFLYDVLLVETQFNYTLPNWTKPVFPDKMREIAQLNFKLPTFTPLLKKLSTGMLLNEIVSHMESKRNGTMKPDVKLWVYSAHDSNVAALLNSLNIYNNILPPYTSAVFLELRKNKDKNDNYVVTVSYRNTSTHDPYLLRVPGCPSEACDLNQFINVLKPILLKDWYKECHKDDENDLWWIYLGVISVLLVFVCILFYAFNKKIFIFYCGRNYQKYNVMEIA